MAREEHQETENTLDVLSAPRPGENQVIWTIWLTYGAFYFCRSNISLAVPGMQLPVSEGGLGLTPGQIGLMLGSLKIAYGIGQFLNGQLAERLPPRKMLAVGMLGSAALSVAFGISSGFYFLLFIWAMNGYCQSLGWTPCLRVAANWIPIQRRGKAIGLIGTGYQLTGALTYVVAGWAAETFGWRGALWLPPIFLVGSAGFMLLFLKETPQAQHADRNPTQANLPQMSSERSTGSFSENLLVTLGNPALWMMAVALFALNACRYGFIDWGPTHLKEIQGETIGKVGLKYAILPLGGIAGAYLAGWASDRFFGSRRPPVLVGLLVILGVLTLYYDSIVRQSFAGTVVLLIFVGFMIFGPQVLLVGTAPSDLARRGTAAAAAGFVNAMGYAGAFTGDQLTGYLLEKDFGWPFVIKVWAGWAFLAAAMSALLWNVTAKPHESTVVDDDGKPPQETA